MVGTTTSGDASTLNGGAIGDCTKDTFSVTSPGNRGSPIICGFNTGQHSRHILIKSGSSVVETRAFALVIVDASDACHKVAFDLAATSDIRQWDIKGKNEQI